ncbi:hypothetical protein [Azospirillum sp. TSO5]|uniref:hypothetical protein n=1 Tax=Azospirillum sp. TSO5 TaxID=716760 RepID=UPI0011B1CB96|nr:hypothetical protein [Azospirillum sp. TSO5]
MSTHTPEAEVIIPPRATAVPNDTAASAPTQRDQHSQMIAETGRLNWQRDNRYNQRALAEAQIGRFKQVIGDALRSHTDEAQVTEIAIAVEVLNRMLDLGRPKYVRVA